MAASWSLTSTWAWSIFTVSPLRRCPSACDGRPDQYGAIRLRWGETGRTDSAGGTT
ncbi:hypothetical protein ACFFX0_16425 [Citricoccus parietis]|uniref:Uncharacterized protein n=1 Tax=Citricoccus parietis TaxID=592307 RepID=A0ABV5G184_9MICC